MPIKLFKNKSIFTKILLSLFVLFFVLVAVASLVIYYLLQPVSRDDKQLSRFVVPKGQSVVAVSERLKENNLIKNPVAFKLYYRLYQDKYNIQAGSFELSPAMSISKILGILSDGADDIWITFPEGLRREEVAQSLNEYNLINYDHDQFLLQTVGMEGRLFPDTYLVPKQITTQGLILLMNNTFEKKIASLSGQINQSNYSLDELIIIASLLEREAKGLTQMKQVAGVLYKRLVIGMQLQVDATLQYAKGFDPQMNTWWSTPLVADKQLNSKFNTYQNPGLPPAPICNPGLDALTATVDFLPSDYLFYLHDRSGQVHFARTLQEHNQNVNTYLR